MDKPTAQQLIKKTFQNPFDRERFHGFIKNLLNHIEETPNTVYQGNRIPDAYEPYIKKLERIGRYKGDPENKIDVLVVYLKKESSLEHARTRQRNFIAWYLNGSRGGELKDAGLVAFVAPDMDDWRFSLVKMEYKITETASGRVKAKEEFTPARRYSFLVGKNETSHTAQSRLVPILSDDRQNPTLKGLEEAFNIEKVTKEFFKEYRGLFLWTKETLDDVAKEEHKVKADFEAKGVNTVDFAKKLLGQVIFLYFLQKKGWFGVARDAAWGTGPKNFLRELFKGKHDEYKNFFNDILEPLFYEALARERDNNFYSRFNCKIPFLNGGLFDPINNYDWVHTDILLPNKLFSNDDKTKEGDTGTGILDVFDRYNFTVKEDEPLEKEVAIDPEMLGKVFENLLEVKDRKSKGTYYTPREIIHYMCRESLVNYLYSELNPGSASHAEIEQKKLFGGSDPKQLKLLGSRKELIPREDVETLIKYGETVVEHDSRVVNEGRETETYSFKLPESIRKNAKLIDEKLESIRVCDPAVGSGAFLVGMMNEIIRSQKALTRHIGKDGERTTYNFKRHAIQNCLYGADIDPGAVEIAKLRLWLSLVVDEEDIKQIKPLPNLDYKIVCGNSLLGVEKNVFNDNLFSRLEELKPLYFNETNPSKKQEYKKQIDDLISQITNGHKDFDFEVYFSEVFHEKKGFDVVIANPPYVGHKGGHKSFFNEMKRTPLGLRFNNERMDLFYYFFHLAIDLSRDRGLVAFITTNYYVTSDGAIKLRRDFRDRATLLALVNFNELKIFESALGQHNMVTVLMKAKDHKQLCQIAVTRHTGFASLEVLGGILQGSDPGTNYRTIPQEQLYEGSLLYISSVNAGVTSAYQVEKILEKLRAQQTLLGHVCNIGQGIVTGLDRISQKHLKKITGSRLVLGQGCFVLTETERKQLSDDSGKIIKPWFKNSDIQRYVTNCLNSEWLIHATVDHDIKKHKAVYKHLVALKEAIQSRNYDSGELSKASKLGRWWALSSARKDFDFTTPKIVVPQRSYHNTFGYNEIAWYASADVYYITPKDSTVALKYILALLNSKLYFAWLYFKGKRKGEMLELYQKPLSEIPIKKIAKNEQQPFIEMVNKILSITKDDDYLENPAKQAKVREYEKQIDQLVYKLYGLTPEEIEIVGGG